MGGSFLLLVCWVLVAAAAPENIVPQLKPSASSQFGSSAGPENTVDFSKLTAWVPATGIGEWIEMDFGGMRSLQRVTIQWEFSLAATWHIEVLNPSGRWIEVARGLKDHALTEVSNMTGIKTDRLRIVCHANGPMPCSIVDVEVWADKDAAPVSRPKHPTLETILPKRDTKPAEPPRVESKIELPTPPPVRAPVAVDTPHRTLMELPPPSLRSTKDAKSSKVMAPVVEAKPAALKVAPPLPLPAPGVSSSESKFEKPVVESMPVKSKIEVPPSDLKTLISAFDETVEGVPLGATPIAEGIEGSVITASASSEGDGRGGKGKAWHASFVVTPEGSATLTQTLGSALPSGWIELSFWFRGLWNSPARLEVVLKDASGAKAAFAVPGTEGGSRNWKQVRIQSASATRIDPNRLKSCAIRFTDKHQSGEIFLDDVWLLGGERPEKKSSRAVSGAPSTSAPASSSDFASAESKIQNPKSKIATLSDIPPWSPYFKPKIVPLESPLPEVRPFDYNPADRKAVHDMLLAAAQNDPKTSVGMTNDEFLDLVERRAFLYFWYGANPENGITLDGANNWKAEDDLDWNSIAAIGFGLTAICIGAERGWITKEMAYERCRVTLDFYLNKAEQRNGFYYHFINRKGVNDRNTELSSIDSLLMYAGMLFAGEYFKGTEVEKMARKIYDRVDWKWMHDNGAFATMGAGANNGGFIGARWDRHCEGQLLSILELGHPQNMPTNLWHDMPEQFGNYQGYKSLNQGPLFTFQFPTNWLDLRDMNDGVVNFWENGVEATLANRYYALEKAPDHKGYGPNSWGFTAGDHPDGYHPFAAPPSHPGENGTITINAAGGSTMYTPWLSTQAMRWMYDNLHDKVWGKYGFTDGYNIDRNWSCHRVIGIGAGPILLSIENHRSGFVWDTFMKIDYVKKGMERIGFKPEPRRTTKVWPLDLTGLWKWNKGDNKNWSNPDFDDSKWREMFVPDRWEAQIMKDGDRKLPEYDGFGWYRLRFDVPQEVWDTWDGQELFLHVGAIDDADETFLNGQKIGSAGAMSAGGATAWEQARKYAVPRKLVNVGGENVLAIRVFDAAGGGGIWMRPVEFGPFLPLEYKPWKAQ